MSKEEVDSYEKPKGYEINSELTADGSVLKYQVKADWIVLQKNEKPVAEMFHVAYLAEDSNVKRPVTFVFNGGPGAASAYLHMGALGPQRVEFSDKGVPLAPPAKVVQNDETWLSFTDLVFIDPIGSGFSRIIKDLSQKSKDEDKDDKASDSVEAVEKDEFWALNRDLESLGEFMSRFLSVHKLWDRPIFIAGESYGGYRAAKFSRYLQEDVGIGLNGAIMISPALELSLLDSSDYDNLMLSDAFPSLVATALYHQRSSTKINPDETLKHLQPGEDFAMGDYLSLNSKGTLIDPSKRQQILNEISALTGLSQDYVKRCHGRIDPFLFARELMRDQDVYCGIYDTSLTSSDPYPDRPQFEGADPTLAGIDRVFTRGINYQLRHTLKVDIEREYRLLSYEAFVKWRIDEERHVFETHLGATDDLRYAMALNPHMNSFIAHGAFDLVTPYFSSKRLTHLMKLKEDQQKRLDFEVYFGGHMFYAWKSSRVKFLEDIKKFYKKSL